MCCVSVADEVEPRWGRRTLTDLCLPCWTLPLQGQNLTLYLSVQRRWSLSACLAGGLQAAVRT